MGKSNRKKFGELLDDLDTRHTDNTQNGKKNPERWSEDGYAVKEVWDCTPEILEVK